MAHLSDVFKLRAEADAAAFVRWFETAGHWVYEYRADAVATLRRHGIEGRPAWSPRIGAALAAWVKADTLPALVAKWDADRVAELVRAGHAEQAARAIVETQAARRVARLAENVEYATEPG